MEKSHAWTEDPVLEEDGSMSLKIDVIRADVEDFATRAYKMVRARDGSCSCPGWVSGDQGLRDTAESRGALRWVCHARDPVP